MKPPAQPDGAGRARSGCAVLLLALAAPVAARGSTPEAWKDFAAEVVQACVAASTLRDARAAGGRIDFDDRIGYSALLITGHYPQPHMNNRSGRELCLFDRRTRSATVAPADGLVPPRRAVVAPAQ